MSSHPPHTASNTPVKVQSQLAALDRIGFPDTPNEQRIRELIIARGDNTEQDHTEGHHAEEDHAEHVRDLHDDAAIITEAIQVMDYEDRGDEGDLPYDYVNETAPGALPPREDIRRAAGRPNHHWVPRHVELYRHLNTENRRKELAPPPTVDTESHQWRKWWHEHARHHVEGVYALAREPAGQRAAF